jgi:mono/diheme cytochrome c family protein
LVGVALIARLCSPALAAAASPQEWPDTFGFAQAQVEAGRSSYAKFCSSCHGDKLDGASAPALTGEAFLTRWASGTRPARDQYDAVSRMPKLAPESLSKSQYLDITSYILATNGLCAKFHPRERDYASKAIERFIAAEGEFATRRTRRISASTVERRAGEPEITHDG